MCDDLRLPVPNNMDARCTGVVSFLIYWTDHRPRCNQACAAGPPDGMTSFEHRQNLTHNAARLIQEARAAAYRRATCDACTDGDTVLPECMQTVCNNQTCQTFPGFHFGLGTGRRGAFEP